MFGPIQVTTNSRRVGASEFPSRKAKQLCELLICAEGRAVTKDRLVDVLWGDKLPQNPSATVDHTVSVLRKVLVADDGSQPIVNDRGRYRIDLTLADVDLFQFDSLVDRASHSPELLSLELLIEAADLAVGPALADEPYAPWASSLRERYRQRVERVILDIARRSLVNDQLGLALRMSERARNESDSVLEEAFALNVSTLMTMGRRHDARVLMTELEQRMKSEFDAQLSPESSMLQTMLRRGAGAPRNRGSVEVATRTVEAIDALPFVERAHELTVVTDALRGSSAGGGEFLVVQGAPGIGTSRFLKEVQGQVEQTVHWFACMPSDAEHPFFFATRLMRTLAHVADLAPVPTIDESASAIFGRLADVVDVLGPTIIVIDDLQWADPGSLAVLSGLTQAGVANPITILAGRHVAAYDRSDPLGVGPDAIVELGPLDRSTVDALPLESAWAETGGHPGLIAACIEAGTLGGRLSTNAFDAILGWVDACGSPTRTALAAAATLPQPVVIDQLAGRLGLSLSSTGELLAHAERLYLVTRLGSNDDAMEFRSALVRRVLQHAVTVPIPSL